MFKDKILLITGGTGSFGNAVVSRFLNSERYVRNSHNKNSAKLINFKKLEVSPLI